MVRDQAPARDGEVGDRPELGHQAPVVDAVADVEAQVGALIRLRPQERRQLVLHRRLQDPLHGLEQLGSEVAPQGVLVAHLPPALGGCAVGQGGGYRCHRAYSLVLQSPELYAHSIPNPHKRRYVTRRRALVSDDRDPDRVADSDFVTGVAPQDSGARGDRPSTGVSRLPMEPAP